MKLDEHPRTAEFTDWFATQRANSQSMSGEYYRVAGPRHTTAKDIVSGIGAYRAGGRWNPLKIMKVVYLSREPETALREANEHFRILQIADFKKFPQSSCSNSDRTRKHSQFDSPSYRKDTSRADENAVGRRLAGNHGQKRGSPNSGHRSSGF